MYKITINGTDYTYICLFRYNLYNIQEDLENNSNRIICESNAQSHSIFKYRIKEFVERAAKASGYPFNLSKWLEDGKYLERKEPDHPHQKMLNKIICLGSNVFQARRQNGKIKLITLVSMLAVGVLGIGAFRMSSVTMVAAGVVAATAGIWAGYLFYIRCQHGLEKEKQEANEFTTLCTEFLSQDKEFAHLDFVTEAKGDGQNLIETSPEKVKSIFADYLVSNQYHSDKSQKFYIKYRDLIATSEEIHL